MNAALKFLLGALAVGLLALAGCGSDSPSVGEGVVARVGDADIKEPELERAIAQRRAAAEQQGQTFPEEGTDAFVSLRRQALQDLVLQRIVDFEARRCGKPCKVDKDAVDAELKNIVDQSFQGDQDAFDSFLVENSISSSDARRIVRFNLQQTALFDQQTRGVRFTATQARAYYVANKQQFETPAGREVSHILVESKELADQIAAEVNLDNFADLAGQHSTDPGSKDSGGSLGRIQRGVFVAEFEKVAFQLANGEISDPVKTQFGWHIITVELIPKTTTSFDEAKDDIQRQQLQQARQATFNAWRDGVLEEWQERTVYASDDLKPEEPEEPEVPEVQVETGESEDPADDAEDSGDESAPAESDESDESEDSDEQTP